MDVRTKSKMETIGELYGMMPFNKRFYLKDKDTNTIVSHKGKPVEYIFTEKGLREKNNIGTNVLSTFYMILTEEFIVVDAPFIPMIGETYYYISASGIVDSKRCSSHDAVTAALITFGNCFETFEEAKRYQNEIYVQIQNIFAYKEHMNLLERRKELV